MKFTFKKGKHSPREWWQMRGLQFSNSMSYKVRFDKSCRYDKLSIERDINKLFGFSWNTFDHHDNSVRFGWRYNNILGKIEIFKYCYKNGVRVATWLKAIDLNQTIELKLQVSGTICYFVIGNSFIDSIDMEQNFNYGVKLRPYFGGNTPAPHTMTLRLD